MRHNAFNIEMR